MPAHRDHPVRTPPAVKVLFFSKILDDVPLSSIHPTADSQQEEIQSGHFSHRRSLLGSWARLRCRQLERVFGQHGIAPSTHDGWICVSALTLVCSQTLADPMRETPAASGLARP